MHPAAAESLQSRLAMLRSGVVLMGWKEGTGHIVVAVAELGVIVHHGVQGDISI